VVAAHQLLLLAHAVICTLLLACGQLCSVPPALGSCARCHRPPCNTPCAHAAHSHLALACADSQKETCQEEGIKGYPTWQLNGKLFSGEKDVTELTELLDKLDAEAR
jgi:hypothetical protein